MKYLIDTHIFLWATEEPDLLSPNVTTLLSNMNNIIILSDVSVWELAIKINIGKLRLPLEIDLFIKESINQMGLKKLPIGLEHYKVFSSLTFPLKEHRDPYDRMLISQSISEKIPIISKDEKFDAYCVERIW